jgi:hypothetical protein
MCFYASLSSHTMRRRVVRSEFFTADNDQHVFTEASGIRHSVEVAAESLYEAVVPHCGIYFP